MALRIYSALGNFGQRRACLGGRRNRPTRRSGTEHARPELHAADSAGLRLLFRPIVAGLVGFCIRSAGERVLKLANPLAETAAKLR